MCWHEVVSLWPVQLKQRKESCILIILSPPGSYFFTVNLTVKGPSKEMACIGNFVRLIHLHERELTSCYAAAGSRGSGESNTVNIKKYKNVINAFHAVCICHYSHRF